MDRRVKGGTRCNVKEREREREKEKGREEK